MGDKKRVELQSKLHAKVCEGKLTLSAEVMQELVRIRKESVRHDPTKVYFNEEAGLDQN